MRPYLLSLLQLGSRLSLTQEQNRALHAEDCMLRSKVDGLQLKLRQSQVEHKWGRYLMRWLQFRVEESLGTRLGLAMI